jgi:uncharacterized C2H2 Zn-finger protein
MKTYHIKLNCSKCGKIFEDRKSYNEHKKSFCSKLSQQTQKSMTLLSFGFLKAKEEWKKKKREEAKKLEEKNFES